MGIAPVLFSCEHSHQILSVFPHLCENGTEAVASWDAPRTIPSPDTTEKSHGAGQAHSVKWFRYSWVATPDTSSPPVARIPRLEPWGVSMELSFCIRRSITNEHSPIPAVLLLVMSNWGQSTQIVLGHGPAVPMNSALGAGGTGIEPAPCGVGAQDAVSPTVLYNPT
jgi:hypothetical protein